MRQSSSARMPSLIGFVAALSLALAVLAQIPVPPANDPDSAGPLRERRLVQRLEQARQMRLRANPTRSRKNRRLCGCCKRCWRTVPKPMTTPARMTSCSTRLPTEIAVSPFAA